MDFPAWPSLLTEESIDAYLLALIDRPGVSDITIQTDDHVFVKLDQVHTRATENRIDQGDIETFTQIKYGASGIALLNQLGKIDSRLEARRSTREAVGMRASYTRCRVGETSDGISITLRRIPDSPLPLSALNLEQDIVENVSPQYGLVLTVGTTGSGKSTIMASVLAHRQQGRPIKQGTFEQPIETTFGRLGQGVMPKITQVEVGQGGHFQSFEMAGPNSMRRGFDVLMVGEVRDRQSAELAFELASTGHAVYTTLHVETVSQTIDRMISLFPEGRQAEGASRLRACLRMVIAQKQFGLIGGGSARIRNYLVFDREVKARLAEARYTEWERIVSEIVSERGATFEDAALTYLRDGRISLEQFCDLAIMTAREARAFCALKGVNV